MDFFKWFLNKVYVNGKWILVENGKIFEGMLCLLNFVS